MLRRTRLNRQITAAGELAPGDLDELARDGFVCVVDLRTPSESPGLLTPEQERERLSPLGIEYVPLPIAEYWVDQQVLHSFHEALCRLPRPLLVHSRTGRRAAVLTLMHMGLMNGWSADRTLELAAQMGFASEGSPLDDAVRNYFEHQFRGSESYCSAG